MATNETANSTFIDMSVCIDKSEIVILISLKNSITKEIIF